MRENSPILITGASGFTGAYVVRHFLAQGCRVRAMVRKPEAGKALKALGAEPVIADLTDPPSIENAVRGTSAVIHVAALFRQAGLPDSEFSRVNVGGTRLLLEAAEAFGVERFVYCSTIGVLGHTRSANAKVSGPRITTLQMPMIPHIAS